MTTIVCTGLGGLLLWVVGYCIGEAKGIRDTESRWYDAVHRDDRR